LSNALLAFRDGSGVKYVDVLMSIHIAIWFEGMGFATVIGCD